MCRKGPPSLYGRRRVRPIGANPGCVAQKLPACAGGVAANVAHVVALPDLDAVVAQDDDRLGAISSPLLPSTQHE
jgi:hypothetical protein